MIVQHCPARYLIAMLSIILFLKRVDRYLGIFKNGRLVQWVLRNNSAVRCFSS